LVRLATGFLSRADCAIRIRPEFASTTKNASWAGAVKELNRRRRGAIRQRRGQIVTEIIMADFRQKVA
jgi:hypothetical protein